MSRNIDIIVILFRFQPKNLTVMFISSRCLPSLYDHFLSGVMLSGKNLLFIQELKTYGRANVEFLKVSLDI